MTIRFANFAFTSDGELLRDGAVVHLQPQPSKVLALLVSRAGELVTREEIQRHVWGDETHVDFDQGLNWCIRGIREVLGDDASAPRFIQTVPRRGYRFIGALQIERPQRRRWPPIAAALVLALFVTGVRFSPPPRVSILVLPFDDLGGTTLHAEDVATNEVISSLARIDSNRLGVIDPLTAMKFKRTNECIVRLGRQLDTQYVLLGAVRGTGERLRVTAQLFRVADNQQAWATARDVPAGSDPTWLYARMAGEIAARVGVSHENS
jgi:DNA-binding winged helix-turn-helix (wHTH) protein/TolB-like protein